jgi:small subunit ribosomal protein S23
MEYRAEKKTKKAAYKRMKQIARLQGRKPPPNPYPSAVKEIQAEERKYVHDRFFKPEILKIVERLKEERAAEVRDRFGGGGF